MLVVLVGVDGENYYVVGVCIGLGPGDGVHTNRSAWSLRMMFYMRDNDNIQPYHLSEPTSGEEHLGYIALMSKGK